VKILGHWRFGRLDPTDYFPRGRHNLEVVFDLGSWVLGVHCHVRQLPGVYLHLGPISVGYFYDDSKRTKVVEKNELLERFDRLTQPRFDTPADRSRTVEL
jgi:hypothetical protein